VLALIRRAQRRFFYNELFAQGANALSAALAAFILLLLAGTQILDWRWLSALPAAAALAGFWAAWRRRPSAYRAAQLVDHRLGLADTLSTALFFREAASAQAAPEVVRLQAAAADRLSHTVDVRAAVPFRVPRTAYPMAALLVLASSLFALRYAVSRRLDLQPPLARILYPNFGKEKTETARNRLPKLDPPRAEARDDNDMASAESQEAKAGDPQDNPSDREDARNQAQAQAKDGPKGAKSQDQDGQAGADSQTSDDNRAGDNADSESGQQGQNAQSKSGNARQDANNSSENSSLMSKVRDAVQNLLSRMKPQQGQSGGQQQSGEQQNSQAGKGQQKGGRQQAGKNGQQQSAQQQADAQDGQSGDPSQNSQDAQGKGTGNSDAKQASKQPGSGIGSQNGDKSIKQAEQLAAMGKISEIIGKRSQNISGETTVEVQSTSQVLKTPYAQRGAQHSQNGAEISRDEIPVALQGYVSQYFEQVRKQKK
jgi:hypothetical protein